MFVRIRFASGCNPGSMRASEPVARMMFFASTVCVPCAPVDLDLAAAQQAWRCP